MFKGQCNCAYWHGIFGGLYLFHLRNAIYNNLIKSEVLIDKANHGGRDFCEIEVVDIDADGFEEVVLNNKELGLYFDPAEGGVLKELDIKSIYHNASNTLLLLCKHRLRKSGKSWLHAPNPVKGN